MGNFRESFAVIRDEFFKQTGLFFQSMARYYGFPENPGMSVLLNSKKYWWTQYAPNRDFPIRKVKFPPHTVANNLLEIFLGGFPKSPIVDRHYYQNKEDGFFSFFIENFRGNFYLPTIISEFVQVQMGFCSDLSLIEFCRETFFGILVIYYYLLNLRILLNWFISINPYTFPLAYYIALIDWFEEWAAQYIPALNGLPIATPSFMFLIGKLADISNNLVLTMPFLPVEGKNTKTMVRGIVRPVKVFKYLPLLWYKYPIPNDIREYWFTDRKDILQYLLKAYDGSNIQFLPDSAVTELQHLSQSIVNITSVTIPADIDLSSFLII